MESPLLWGEGWVRESSKTNFSGRFPDVAKPAFQPAGPTRSALFAGLDEGGEDGLVFLVLAGEAFGMVLDADEIGQLEGAGFEFHHFDEAVGTEPGGHEGFGGFQDRLMVGTVHAEPGAAGDAAVRRQDQISAGLCR